MSEAILAIIERLRGEVKEYSLDASGLANKLGLRPCCVDLISPSDKVWSELTKFYEEVICIRHELLSSRSPDVMAEALIRLIAERGVRYVVAPHSSMGIEVAPYLAVKMRAPLVTDVVDLELLDGRLRAKRYLHGGKVVVKVEPPPSKCYVITLRPGVFKPALRAKPGKVVELSYDLSLRPSRKCVGYVEPKVGEVDITKSPVIVSVGRGLRDPKNLTLIEDLARMLGGVVAGSRPVIDKGWLPKDRQVGSSGKTVKPKLYLALGISGSFQHVVGMKDSELIIAVNKDPNAPIFNVAHYGVVDDLLKVATALRAQLSKAKA
ncbi:MAG: electron transfer flavoprotein subunit alpha/FixB family protein [Candidatus Nezhaarchaeales archaeon]